MIDDDDSIAAAEYVLGVTDLADRSAVVSRNWWKFDGGVISG